MMNKKLSSASPASHEPIPIVEADVTILGESTVLEGKVILDQVTRVHGTMRGEVLAGPGSTVILTESAIVEGKMKVDTLWIDGFVQGEIEAKSKVAISRTGRVIGKISSPSISIDFGAYFDGTCSSGVESSLKADP